MEKKKIVFLYSELATYFLACIQKLLIHPKIEVHIMHWEVNKEAPFSFSFSPDLHIYKRSDYSNEGLMMIIKEIDPAIIYVSGWMDSGYLQVCKNFKKKIPVIVGFDNQWKGTIKQQIARLVSPFKILNHFTHCWIPGKPQEKFALYLGFKKENILTGFYSCDYDLFHSQYLKNKNEKQKKFPKRFIYVGRYLEHKGIQDLWTAFIELQNESPNEWELWCLGTGELKPIEHPRIKHFGFVQPVDLPQYIEETGVFVLPSHFEPWGVVVHEFVSAGFPVVCSNEVGAGTAFVENNYNGYIYNAGDIQSLKNILKTIISSSQDKLFQMAENSVRKSDLITPEKWSKQLMSLLC
jgi:glycosyltransferase involved in cell wall biosynthesis